MMTTEMDTRPATGHILARPSTSLAPRILILGGGFAGVTAALELAKRCAGALPVHITLLSNQNFFLFGWLTLFTEIFIAASHLLGLFTRLGALAAFGMATNRFIGLARHPSEGPWSYLMMIGFAILFLSTHAGRVFGLDGVLARRVGAAPAVERRWARVLALLA